MMKVVIGPNSNKLRCTLLTYALRPNNLAVLRQHDEDADVCCACVAVSNTTGTFCEWSHGECDCRTCHTRGPGLP